MPNEWQTVLDEIKNNVSEMAFATYFLKFDFVSNDNGILTVAVPSIFVKTQIEGKYRSAIEDALKTAHFNYKELKVILNKGESKVSRGAREVPVANIPTANHKPVTSTTKATLINNDTGLNPRYRLDNYVVGSNNDLAVSAAHAIIENPGVRYNPYFIYGGPGLGKTHLIQAIGNELLERNPNMKVLYVTIEQFYHDFVEAMRKKLDGFTDKYRKVDVLIVDDFQFIVGKEKSQDEFFHTFNELHQHNKQIIVSSDRLPTQIATVDERLASRLMMGVPIDIQMPDFETRCAILKTKAEMVGVTLSDKTVEYIAENIRNNIRDLEGKLNQVLAWSEMRGISPDDLIDEGLIIEPQDEIKRNSISPKQVIDKVAKYYDLTGKELYGTSRVKNIKDARQVAMFLLKDQLGLSTVRIGQEFNKDHTTIMHGIKKIENDLKINFNLRQQITDLRSKINAN